MLYRPLKLMVITATVFVWLRLLVGGLEVLNNPKQNLSNQQKIASETTSYIQR